MNAFRKSAFDISNSVLTGQLKLIFVLWLLSFDGVVAQQENSVRDTVQLEEVQITAARISRPLRQVAAPVQVVEFPLHQGFTSGDLTAALSVVPGVQLQSGTAQTLRLTLRGIGSRSQYGTNRSRVYLNEIPLTGGDGTSVFDDLEVSFLQRAELTKGSYSAWHGSGMGGSVRFVSRRLHAQVANRASSLSSGFSAEAGVVAGSFGHVKWYGLAELENHHGFLSAGVARVSGDGYRENSAYTRTSGIVTGDWKWKNRNKLSYLFMLSDVHAYTPSSVDELTFRERPTAAAANWLAVKGFKEYSRWLAGIKYESLLAGRWVNSMHLSLNNYDQFEKRPFNLLDDHSVTLSVQETIRYTTASLSAMVGAEALMEHYNWEILENETSNQLLVSAEQRRNFNVFSAIEYTPFEKLRISMAVNAGLTSYKLKPGDETLAHTVYTPKPIFSPLFGIMYQPAGTFSIYASAGHGFSNPTVEEGLSSEGDMNPGLRPEQGWSIDLGAKSVFFNSRLTLQGSVYAILLSDLLVVRRPEETVFYGSNAGSSVLKGLEAMVDFRPVKQIRYTLTASLSDNRFKEFEEEGTDYSGNQLPGIPFYQLYSGLETVLSPHFRWNFTCRRTGTQYADDANAVKIKAWQTFDMNMTYEAKLFKTFCLRVQFAVNNLFDAHYASMVLINAPSFSGRPPRYYYPAFPRNFNTGIQLKW